jgi:hypothetical protein
MDVPIDRQRVAALNTSESIVPGAQGDPERLSSFPALTALTRAPDFSRHQFEGTPDRPLPWQTAKVLRLPQVVGPYLLPGIAHLFRIVE